MRTRSTESRNALILHFLPLAKFHARRLARRVTSPVDLEDLQGAARDGLMEAVTSFDPSRNIKFETYASRRIIGAILDWLRDVDPHSRAVRHFERRRLQAWAVASSDLGHDAQAPEVADYMDISRTEYHRFMCRRQAGRRVSLNAPSSHAEDAETAAPPDLPDDDSPPPTAPLEREWLREYFCKGLNKSERYILILYYYEDLSMFQIGETLGLSESRVSQIHGRIIEKLQYRFEFTSRGQDLL